MAVDRQVLRRFLKIPDDVQILDLYYDIMRDQLMLRLKGERFPPHDHPGRMLTEVVAVWRDRDAIAGDRITEHVNFSSRDDRSVWYGDPA